MASSARQNDSGQDKMPQYATGEILNGEYRVFSVEENEDGRPLYRCSRLSDDEEVLVCCLGKKGSSGNPLTVPLGGNKQDSAEVPFEEGLQYIEHFELQSGKDTLIYGVQNRMGQESARDEVDLENPEGLEQPQHRFIPFGPRIRICKMDDRNLEVNFLDPFDVRLVWLIITVGTTGPALVGTYIAVAVALSLSNPSDLWMVLAPIPLWVICWYSTRATIRSLRCESLTITPTSFHLKRTLEFRPQHRDSVYNPDTAAAELTCLDRILCRQVTGDSRNLTRVETKKHKGIVRGMTWHMVLVEGVKKHALCTVMSAPATMYIYSEISKTLASISDMDHAPVDDRSSDFVHEAADV